MSSINVKSKPLTIEESRLFISLIENSKVITCKATDATSNKLKAEEWTLLTEKFNAAAYFPRSSYQLRMKWENLKKSSRKRSMKIMMNQTSDSPEYIPPDEILDRVANLIGTSVNGYMTFDDFQGIEEFSSENCEGNSHATEYMKSSIEEEYSHDSQQLESPDEIEVIPDIKYIEPKEVRKKLSANESRISKNDAITEYYKAKKQCLDAKLNNIILENDTLKLKNIKLQLSNKKLLLETEKLKLKLTKLRSNQ